MSEVRRQAQYLGMIVIGLIIVLSIRGGRAFYDDFHNIQRVWSTKEVMQPAVFIFCAMMIAVIAYCIYWHIRRTEEHEEIMGEIRWVPVFKEQPKEIPIEPQSPDGVDLYDPEMAILEWNVKQEEAYNRIYANRGSYSWVELEQLRQEYHKQGAKQLATKIHDNLQKPWRRNTKLDRKRPNPDWREYVTLSPESKRVSHAVP